MLSLICSQLIMAAICFAKSIATNVWTGHLWPTCQLQIVTNLST